MIMQAIATALPASKLKDLWLRDTKIGNDGKEAHLSEYHADFCHAVQGLVLRGELPAAQVTWKGCWISLS